MKNKKGSLYLKERAYPAIAPLLHNNEVKVETWQNNQFYPRNELERFQK
ncbi:hypothetical protein [Xenorhabdus ishibashii]|nr:hypothetical protein [Xenorhabdus ishibashii]